MNITIDIETENLDPDSLELEQRLLKPAANIKDAGKIASNLAQRRAALLERQALTQQAPIGCISVLSDDGAAFVFHQFGTATGAAVTEIVADTETEMLQNFQQWLDRLPGESRLIGFNLLNFDLPKIRFAYARHGLQLPRVLVPGATDICDVMLLYCQHFAVQRPKFAGLSEIALRLGVQAGTDTDWKNEISGAAVPGLIQAGQFQTVVEYCVLDTLVTWRAYKKMGGV